MNELQLDLSTIKRDWLEHAAFEFEMVSHKLGLFTTDDLHRILPTPSHENWWGILAAQLKNKGLIRRVNAVPSRRPEANGRLVSVWEVTTP